jgi:predicted kinase
MKLIILRGKTGSGKSTLQNLIVGELNYVKVEIDEIKVRKYGTTTRCNPPIDFKEAGLIAKGLLTNGHNVVVEEAFLELSHIQYFLRGLENLTPSIFYVRLECSEETSMNRKRGILDDRVVHSQHLRSVEDIDGELIFNTDKSTVEDTLQSILRHVNDI